ncbi:MAG: molybdopterin-binding protein, partial [Selenomonadaceae bacterium]|nr:molybdopterin-binding protein [Selenomonadaceae bacterium]
MKEISVHDAVGSVLVHDITEIVRGVVKDARFRKGHVVREEDIPVLLRLGKEHIFVWEDDESKLHENDAAEILRAITQGENLSASDVKEGKIELKATCDGVFHVDVEKLNAINAVEEICIATLANNIPVRKNKSVAAMRVIPLVIDKAKPERVKEIAGAVPLMKIAPYKNFKVGLVVTGSEIFHERIKDTFTPVIEAKLKSFGLQVDERRISDDSKEMTREKISELLSLGCEMILATGGMSVDPDDKTPAAITLTGAEVVTYGVPVLPGAMFMLAYLGD